MMMAAVYMMTEYITFSQWDDDDNDDNDDDGGWYLLKSPPARGIESFPGFTRTSNIPQTGLWSDVVTPDHDHDGDDDDHDDDDHDDDDDDYI